MGVLILAATVMLALYVPTLASQPGGADDPLVTRRFVEERIAQVTDEIAVLRNIVATLSPGAVAQNVPPAQGTTAGFTQTDRDALFAEIMLYFELVYGERLNQALANVPAPGGSPDNVSPPPSATPQTVAFEVLHMQAGQTITFESGTEFILRGGSAVALTGPYNGIPDVTAGADVMNGQAIGSNHLMIIPVTDGRGMIFQTESWVMVRGGYTIVN